MSTERPPVPANKLAQLGACEVRLVLDARYGDTPSAFEAKRRAEGKREHAAHDERSRAHHNAEPARDRRCFIASHVYGVDAPETEQLRAFRDRVLATSSLGRAAIARYYALAPHVVRLLEQHPRAVPTVRALITTLRVLLCPSRTAQRALHRRTDAAR